MYCELPLAFWRWPLPFLWKFPVKSHMKLGHAAEGIAVLDSLPQTSANHSWQLKGTRRGAGRIPLPY